MSNLRIFSVDVQAISPQLVTHLESHCNNVRGVEVTGFMLPMYYEQVPKTWTEWIVSQKKLRVIFGRFTQDQMIHILGNSKTNKLVVYNMYVEQRTLIEDRLHKLIIDLSQRQVLVKYYFPGAVLVEPIVPSSDRSTSDSAK